jgi:hypothetical protein
VTFMVEEVIMPNMMMNWSLLLLAGSLFIAAIVAFVYVSFRFMSLVLSMEVGILKEFKTQREYVQPVAHTAPDTPVTENKIKDFIKSRFAPTDGAFEGYNDEDAFIQEKVEDLRRQGLTPEELDEFVRHAVGTDIGKPEN